MAKRCRPDKWRNHDKKEKLKQKIPNHNGKGPNNIKQTNPAV